MLTVGSDTPQNRLGVFGWMGRWVGRVRWPFRRKLLLSFVSIAALLVSLALVSLAELKSANTRASGLFDNVVRIGSLRTLEESTEAVRLSGLNLFAVENDQEALKAATSRFKGDLNWLRQSLAGNVGIQRATQFADGQRLAEITQLLRDAVATGYQVAQLAENNEVLEAKNLYASEFFDQLGKLDQMAFSFYFEFREKMRASAEDNDLAYESSQKLILFVSCAAVLLSIVMGYSISTAILYPLNQVGKSLSQISQAHFDARTSVPNRDEFGELATNLNSTAEQLGNLYSIVESQKNELENLNATLEEKVVQQVEMIERTNRLRKFLPSSVAKMIVEAPDGENYLGSQRREITSVFADLRGFTAYSTAATPAKVVEALNAFHAVAGPLIEKQGGTLERFLGDGLMVLFGAPFSTESPVKKAVELAEAMQRAVRPALDPFRLENASLGLGIGIATGYATVGQIGFSGRLDYSAIGPGPNLASRLCDLASDGKILMCETCATQFGPNANLVGKFQLRGLENETPAYEPNYLV